MEEKNGIEEFQNSKNFKGLNFTYDNINYEMNASLYSNAIFVFISYNGKISNLYELNFDYTEELEMNELYNIDNENLQEISLSQCILGKRDNDKLNFIANFTITNIKNLIINISTKINKICLSLSLDSKLLENVDDTKFKGFLNIIKEKTGILFNTKNL